MGASKKNVDQFPCSGDLDGDGVGDLAAGAIFDDDGCDGAQWGGRPPRIL
ncbi:MAG: hypothetical protein V3T70_00920 [Phycisphaerae bacterium]